MKIIVYSSPQDGKSALVTVARGRPPRTAEKISWSVAQFITKAVIFPTSSHCLCFFFTNRDQTENFLQSLGAMRGSTGPSESLRSLVEFRPWFHICHICDFIFATFVILYLPPPPSSSPVDIFLRTSICHLTCVKVAPENICHLRCVKSAPDNQTAGGAKPSLFCNMPRFWDTLYFSVKKVFISASLKGRAALSAPLWSLSSQFMSSPSKLGRALAEICFSWICRKHFCCYVPEVFYTKVYSYRKFLLICQYENKHSLWHVLGLIHFQPGEKGLQIEIYFV